MEVSPVRQSKVDYFLHVLAATDASVNAVPAARVTTTETQVKVTVGKAVITFDKANVGGSIIINSSSTRGEFPTKNVSKQSRN